MLRILTDTPRLFTDSTPPAKASSYTMLIGRLVVYPSCFLLGSLVLTILGQGSILASLPPLVGLILLSALSASLLTPIFYGIKLFIDRYGSHTLLSQKGAYMLLFLTDIFMNMTMLASLSMALYRPVMNTYALYSVFGAGVVPVIIIAIGLLAVTQAYHSHKILSFESESADEMEERVVPNDLIPVPFSC